MYVLSVSTYACSCMQSNVILSIILCCLQVRKLEFIFADLLEKGCDSVVTAGGIQSNHCRTTALVAAQCGVQPHVVLIPDEKGITVSHCTLLSVS